MRAHFRALLAALLVLTTGSAFAERTDEVVLWNGNTVTGEVKSLQQGKLKLRTDHAGTIYIEWEFVNSVTSSEFFEVEDQRGEFFYGMLVPGPEQRTLVVMGPTQTTVLEMERVVEIMPIKQTFWGRIDGSLNLGASFSSADNILQYSFESDATYRVRKFSARVSLSSIETLQEERDNSFRDNFDFTYTRFHKKRYFGSGIIGFDRSSELGIDLRVQVGGLFGRTLVQSTRSRMYSAVGLIVSRETPAGDQPNDYVLSGSLRGRYDFFLYNFPRTDISISVDLLPSISEWPRLRLDSNLMLKREIITDFTVNFSAYDSYDSDPPGGAEAANHDFGVILSVGWIF